MENMSYTTAIKKANLVERNPAPNGSAIIDLLRVSAHQESDILSLALQIQQADETIKNSTCGKLGLILEQIRALQKQAQKILVESERDRQLHNAACNFTKKPGNIYHLYCKPSGQKYFSLLSPEEWNGSSNQTHVGSFRLENDFSWTPVDEIDTKDQSISWANELLTAQGIPSIEYK